MVKVHTEQHNGTEISSRVTLHGAKVLKPLLALPGVIDKSKIVFFFLRAGAFSSFGQCAGVTSVRKTITGV